jgi:hypothetical protein
MKNLKKIVGVFALSLCVVGYVAPMYENVAKKKKKEDMSFEEKFEAQKNVIVEKVSDFIGNRDFGEISDDTVKMLKGFLKQLKPVSTGVTGYLLGKTPMVIGWIKYNAQYYSSNPKSLNAAIMSGNLGLVKNRIEKNKDKIAQKDEFGQNALHHVAANLDVSNGIVEYLVKKGVAVDDTDLFGRTPLHIAAALAKYVLVMTFLSCGAEVTIKDKDKGTPLHRAIMGCQDKGVSGKERIQLEKKYLSIVAALIAADQAVKLVKNSDEKTPIKMLDERLKPNGEYTKGMDTDFKDTIKQMSEVGEEKNKNKKKD